MLMAQFRKKYIVQKKNNYATKYEKLDLYTNCLENNYTKLEIRKENIYTTNYNANIHVIKIINRGDRHHRH